MSEPTQGQETKKNEVLKIVSPEENGAMDDFNIILYSPEKADSYAAAMLAQKYLSNPVIYKFDPYDDRMFRTALPGASVLALGIGQVIDEDDLEHIENVTKRFVMLDPEPEYELMPHDASPVQVADPFAGDSCVLAVWHYFHGDETNLPAMYKYVASAFAPKIVSLPRADYVWLALSFLPDNELAWNTAEKQFNAVQLSVQGVGIRRQQSVLVEQMASHYSNHNFGGMRTNFAYAPVLAREVAVHLARNQQIGVAYMFSAQDEGGPIDMVRYTVARGKCDADEFEFLFETEPDAKFVTQDIVEIEVLAHSHMLPSHSEVYRDPAEFHMSFRAWQDRLLESAAERAYDAGVTDPPIAEGEPDEAVAGSDDVVVVVADPQTLD